MAVTIKSDNAARGDRYWVALVWVVLGGGVLFRLVHYLNNRSIWLDEALLARNIVDRGPLALLRPLDHYQTAPVLLRLLLDAATVPFGPNELALRLVPFLASVVSLWLYWVVGRRFFDRGYLVAFLALCAFSYPLVYHAQELKPYAVDVAVALALTEAFLRLMRADPLTPGRVALLGLGGVLAILMSHTAVFVLAGLGLVLLVVVIRAPHRRVWSLGTLLGLGGVWMLTCGAQYWLCVRTPRSNAFLRDFFADGFLPAPTSLEALHTWGVTLQALVRYSGFPSAWTLFVVLLLAAAVAETLRRRRLDTGGLLLIGLVTLAASVLQQYPLASANASNSAASYGRLSLFLVPPLYLLLVRGVQIMAGPGRPAVAGMLAAGLLIPSLSSALALSKPILREEVRPVLQYVRAHWEPQDRVYVYYRDPHAVKYYRGWLRFPEESLHWGRWSIRQQPHFGAEIEAMRRWPRVWFLVSHRYEEEERDWLTRLEGELLDQYQAPGVSVYLYRFPVATSEAREGR
jgi:Dolichyl-phosphate-mannose-protein mannosyltransferase